jgi:hypothetical protein
MDQQDPFSFAPTARIPSSRPPKLSWAFRRQFTYLAVFFVFATTVGYAIFSKVGPQATCTDGIHNQTEIGIDCGGVCERVCPNQVVDLEIGWSKVFPASDGTYDAVALVTNPNISYGLGVLHYRFSLFDEKNLLVAQREGDTFVNPQERFVLYEPSIVTGSKIPYRAVVQFEDPDIPLPWKRALLPIRPRLSVEGKRLKAGENPELLVDLVNRSVADATGVQALAILLDKDDTPIGIRSTYLDGIKRNHTIPVTFVWEDINATAASGGQVFPRATADGIR